MRHTLTAILLCLFFVFVGTASAQKALKPVRTALKNNKYKDALTLIANIRKDSTLADNPKLCLYGIEANRGLNDAENVKLYLKKSYDTLAFFSTTHEIIRECIRLDSIERAKEATLGEKRHYQRIVKEETLKYFPNLNVAARYFYKQKKFAEAMPYLSTCIELPKTEMGREIGLDTNLAAQKNLKNMVFYTTSAFFAKQYAEVWRYHKEALQDSVSRMALIYYYALTSEAQNDTASYRRWLETGWCDNATQPPFFIRLADYHSNAGNFAEVLRMSQYQLSADSSDLSALFAMSNAYLHLQQYDEAAASGKELLAKDSTNAEAYFFVGSAYVAQSKNVILPDNINSSAYRKALSLRRKYAEEAMPFLEQYRVLTPGAQKKWAPLLYHVYLTLNKGKKFAEIEKIMQ